MLFARCFYCPAFSVPVFFSPILYFYNDYESRGQFVCTCSACEALLEKPLEFSSLVCSLFCCLVLCF